MELGYILGLGTMMSITLLSMIVSVYYFVKFASSSESDEAMNIKYAGGVQAYSVVAVFLFGLLNIILKPSLLSSFQGLSSKGTGMLMLSVIVLLALIALLIIDGLTEDDSRPMLFGILIY